MRNESMSAPASMSETVRQIPRRISRRFNKPWKRIAFIILCMPIVGLLLATVGIGYFYHKANFSDEAKDYLFVCHQHIASQELSEAKIDKKADERTVNFEIFGPEYRLAKQRMADRYSAEVQEIEDGYAFTLCIKDTELYADILNLEYAYTEIRNFALWSVIAVCLMLSLNVIENFFRWIWMR